MKYMLMMNSPGDTYQIMQWPEEDIRAHIDFMHQFAAQYVASGELVAAEGLSSPEQARRVKADEHGAPVTDGIFPETKEFLAGYWIFDVEDEARAHAIAAHASTAPGIDGVPLNMWIEVRQIMTVPASEHLL